MPEIYGLCQQCGKKMSFGNTDKMEVVDDETEELITDRTLLQAFHRDMQAWFRDWLKRQPQPCPGCGGPLRVPEEA